MPRCCASAVAPDSPATAATRPCPWCDAGRVGRPRGAHLRDAGRAHARAGPAARRANPDAGYEPLLDDSLRPVLAHCLERGHPHRQQLRRRQPARRGAHGIAALAAGLGLPRRASPSSRATTCSPHCAPAAAARASCRPQLTIESSSAPTPTSAPSRSPMRCARAPRSS